MSQLNKYKINLSLVENFQLSDKAVFAYIAILMTYQLEDRQAFTLSHIIKNIFGFQATNTEILRQGINELVEKEVIKISHKEDRAIFYDLTLLREYEGSKWIRRDKSFFEKFEDLSGLLCSLYRLYLTIEYLINEQKNEGESVLVTSKRALAHKTSCSRATIGNRLKKLEELGFIKYEDCSDYFNSYFEEKPTLFISFPEDQSEIMKVLKETMPEQYLKDKKLAQVDEPINFRLLKIFCMD